MFFSGILCVIFTFHVRELHGKVTENYRKTLSTFIELHTSVCGYVPLCTIKNGTNSTQYYPKKPCCRPCSCDSRCHDNQTCCLDFWIRDAVGDGIVENISEIINILASNMASNSDWFKNTSLAENITEKCVSAELVKGQLPLDYRHKSEAFPMVSVCPDSYTSKLKKGKCEGVNILKGRPIDENIPVTSVESFKSYRNKYCMFCNEGNDTEYMVWTSMLTCVRKSVAQNFIVRPTDLFKKISSGSLHACNIVFQPPSEMKQHVESCEINDVISCKRNLTTFTNNTQTSDIYNEMCSIFDLPVYTTDTITLTKFKNVACFMCGEVKHEESFCEAIDQHSTGYNLEINVFNNGVAGSFESTDYIALNLSLTHEDFTQCGVGFVHDAVSETCRKILCPRHHYIHHRVCVPMIRYVHDVFYSVILEARPNISLSRNRTILNIYESQLALKLSEKVNTHLPNITFGIWRMTKRRQVPRHFIFLDIVSENETYAYTLNQIAEMLNSVSSISFSDIEIEIGIARKAFSRSFQNVIKIDTFTQLTSVRKPQRQMGDLKEFEISSAHLCYRIALNLSEVLLIGKSAIEIVSSGKRVVGLAFEADRKLGFLACIDDVVLETTKTWRSAVDTDSQQTQWIVLGTVSSVMLFMSLTCVRGIKHFRNKRATRRSA